MNKHLGSTLHFQCRPTSCNRGKHNYTHYNQMTGEPDLVVEAAKYTKKLSSFDHGGDYCCNEQCAGVSTSFKCCITVASKTDNNIVSQYSNVHTRTCSFTCDTMGHTKSCCSQWRSVLSLAAAVLLVIPDQTSE